VGILVGTYSSIYVASPFALLWERMFGAKTRDRRGVPGGGRAPEPEPTRPGEPVPPAKPARKREAERPAAGARR
jgi:hypothetical protein